jgi:hypothetical protein
MGMSETQRLTPAPMPMPRSAAVPALAFAAIASCVAAGLAITAAIVRRGGTTAAPADPCALPAGVDFTALSETDRSYVARHAIACSDFEHGRIDRRALAAKLKALDFVPPTPIVLAPPTPAMPPAPVWASSVRGFSSQYTDSSWAAARVLGPPDVYPASGDNENAWASTDADARTEYLEVGFDAPQKLRAVDIFETYNPGAISHVEVITADGKHRAVYDAVARPMNVPSFQRTIPFACTDQPVVAVKVTLSSAAVPGWNEIDAIGGTPCD